MAVGEGEGEEGAQGREDSWPEGCLGVSGLNASGVGRGEGGKCPPSIA